MPTLELICERLRQHRPVAARVHPGSTFEASVALLVHEPIASGPELLFIQRALREGDPWSGHMAFPGGRREPGDPDLQATASRETQEEIGFRPERAIGRLDDFSGSRGPRIPDLVVGAFVYHVESRPRLRLNEEVRSTVWVPLEWILSPESLTMYRLDDPSGVREMPALRYRDYVVWGLTYRILGSFLKTLGKGLPSHEGR